MEFRIDRRPPQSGWDAAVSTPQTSDGKVPRASLAHRQSALRRLGDLGFQALGPIGHWRTYERGAVVLRQGDRGTRFYVVISGLVKASCEDIEGHCLILGLYGPGEVVGIASALCERQRRVSIIAAQPSECLEVDKQALLTVLADRPGLIAELLPRLARSLVSCTNCLAKTMNQHVEPRLACLFLTLLDRTSTCEQKGWISKRWSRQELAELIGTTTESVSRVMSRWRKRNVVITADDGFWIRDLPALKQIALGK